VLVNVVLSIGCSVRSVGLLILPGPSFGHPLDGCSRVELCFFAFFVGFLVFCLLIPPGHSLPAACCALLLFLAMVAAFFFCDFLQRAGHRVLCSFCDSFLARIQSFFFSLSFSRPLPRPVDHTRESPASPCDTFSLSLFIGSSFLMCDVFSNPPCF